MPKFNKNLKRGRVRPECMDYALFLVSLRAQSAATLKEKLERKGYQDKEIADCLVRLTELRYLDDEQFAQIFFDNLLKYKHFGYYGIKRKLMQKKIPQPVVEKLLKSLTLVQEKEIAKRALGTKQLSWEQIVRKLQSRGFRSEVTAKFARAKAKRSFPEDV